MIVFRSLESASSGVTTARQRTAAAVNSITPNLPVVAAGGQQYTTTTTTDRFTLDDRVEIIEGGLMVICFCFKRACVCFIILGDLF